MGVYISSLFLVSIIAYFTSKKKINKWIIISLVSIPLVLVCVCRWNVGTDFPNYYYLFQKIQTYPLATFFSFEFNSIELMERGFCIIIWLLGKINSNSQFLIGVVGSINIIVMIYVLKKYSKNFTLSVYLYITSMVYFTAFNGIRQSLASTLLFLCLKFVINRNFKKYLICVILISFIHISALIMIPVYFLVNSKPFGKKMFCVIIITGIVIFSLSNILEIFMGGFSNTKYEGYSSISKQDDGVNVFRVAVSAVPVLLSFVYYKKNNTNKETDILINFSLINLLIMIISMRKTVIARFSIYLEPYNLLLYPIFLKLFKKEQRYLYGFLMLICFFVYMYLLLPMDSNLLPYKTFWNNM